MKHTTRKDRAGKGSARSDPFYEGSWQRCFRKDSIFRCKILSLLYEAICFYPCIHHFCSLRRSGAGERRHDRHGVLLPAAAGTARGRAGQPDLRGGAARRAGADASGRVHLVDLLHGEGFAVAAIFSPEHGFRGTADAGEQVASSVDARTGIPIRSLYDGNAKQPSDEAMRSFDVLVVDMQDVGLRFYTYYISMLRMMDACADFGRRVVVLDRPNPNGHLVDGPVLDMKYKSGVGAIPVPVLHGLTMGEIARMARRRRVGEAVRPDGREVPQLHPCHRIPLARRSVAQPSDCARRLSLCRAVPLRGHGREPRTRNGLPVRNLRTSRYDRTRLFLYAAPHGRGQTSAARRPAVPRRRPARHAALEAREVGFSLRYVIDAYRDLGLGTGSSPRCSKSWSVRDGCAG